MGYGNGEIGDDIPLQAGRLLRHAKGDESSGVRSPASGFDDDDDSGSSSQLLTKPHTRLRPRTNRRGSKEFTLSAEEAQLDDDDFASDDDMLPENQNGQDRRQRRRRMAARKAGSFYQKHKRKILISGILIFGFVGLIGILGGSVLVWTWRKSPPDGESPPWYPTPRGGTTNAWAESYRKAQEMVNRMSLVEKVNITTGTGWKMGLCVGNTAPALLAGFPALCLQDGPLGIRFADHITAFPAGITVGATWNRALMFQRGQALGREARGKGVNVLLGPSMGPLGKLPAGGRNWEGFGSDPVLQGVGAFETIRGIQGEGVMATAKHFVLNEQEHFRRPTEWGLPHALSSNIDDRSLHELYVWPFADSVRAGVASVMCSYQMVNNSYACGNSKILNGILKDELGFQGFVQSDWLAQRSGVASALAGLDMSMPGDGLSWEDGKSLWGHHLTRAALNTSLPMERLNDMVTRIVSAWYQVGQDSWPKPAPEGDGGPNFSSWTDRKVGRLHPGSDDNDTAVVNKFIDVRGDGDKFNGGLARRIAAEGVVLLKNTNGILPLPKQGPVTGDTYRIGVFGEDAGGGRGPNACADRGCNQGTLASGWGSGAVDFDYLIHPWYAIEAAYKSPRVKLSAYLTNTPGVGDATDKDLCIVFANADAGEGYLSSDGNRGDRNDLKLQKGGDKLIEDVAKWCGRNNGKTIVVIHSVGPVILERLIRNPKIDAILMAGLPGAESGFALADVLFGDIDASGRLPYTIGQKLADYGPGAQVMYYPNDVIPQMNFSDGLYIDYRHFDKYNVTPRYEFGYGLSYTTFSFSDLEIIPLREKTPLPAPRPAPEVPPPNYGNEVPDPETALFPKSFRKLKKYVYPYISDVGEAVQGTYEAPPGYDIPQEPSQAGGGEGGNPALYEPFVRVSAKITNTGARVGNEVVQVYVSFPDGVIDTEASDAEGGSSSEAAIASGRLGDPIDFPVRVLRNFEKVGLAPGKEQIVSMELTRRDLSYWSARRQNWVMPTEGKFKIWVGKSSRKLPLMGEF